MPASVGSQPAVCAARPRSFRAWLGRGIALSLLAVACIAAWWLGSRQPTPIEEGLYVDPKYLDFGEVWENPKFEWVLPIENKGASELAIAGFSSSCTCLAIQPAALTIPPLSTAEVRLTLDLSYRPQVASAPTKPPEGSGFRAPAPGQARPAEQSLREFRLRIAAATRRATSTAWDIRGRVRSAILVTPRHLTFDLLEGVRFASQSVDVTAVIPLEDVVARVEPRLADVRVERNRWDKSHFVVEISPQASLPPGPFTFHVYIAPARTSEQLPAIPVVVEGSFREDLQVTPSPLLLGARPIGEIVRETIAVRSLSGKPFEVAHVTTPTKDTLVQRLDGPDPVFRVEQHISGLGTQTSRVDFAVRTAAGNARSVELKIGYYGMPKILSPSNGAP